MSSKLSNPILVAAIALLAGCSLTYSCAHVRERAFFARAFNRVPHGYIIAESKGSDKTVLILDLNGTFDFSPGDPIRYHSGATSASPFGKITFSYPTTDLPRFGDIILVQLETFNGNIQNFVISNGNFRTILESEQIVISYRENRNTRRNA